MSSRKLTDFDSQLDQIRMHLPSYLREKGYDVTNGNKICCLSPEHDDKHPSMSMFIAEQAYPLVKCMGCGVTMDIFNAANILEGRPIMGPGFINNTVSYLADKFGIELTYKKMSEDEMYELNMYQAYDAVANYIIAQTDFNDLQIEEIKKRKLTPEFMKKYLIGICNDVNALRENLKMLGFMSSFIDEIDLSNKYIFNERSLIYTICDDYGRPVAFSARNLKYDGVRDEKGNFINGPKFVSSRTVIKKNIFKKNERLYLLDKAKKTSEPIIVVEGISDALTLHINGVINAVGVLGSEFSETHVDKLRRNGIYDIIICLDNDSTGIEKAKKLLDSVVAKTHDIRFRFIFLPDEYDEAGAKIKSDPDEFIRKYGINKFKELPRIDSFTWRLSQFDTDEFDSESVTLALIPIITSEPSPIRREKMIAELSLFTGYSDKVIRDEVNKSEIEKTRRVQNSKKHVIEKLVKELESSEAKDPELIINEALSNIHQINQSHNAGLMETSTRINNILSIKEYQEDTENSSYVNWGPDMPYLSATTDGDIKAKLIFIGGGSNVGKTSWQVNLSWRIVENNSNAIVVFLSIDDSAKELLPRLICYDSAQRAWDNQDFNLFNVLNINKFAKPELYRDSREYAALCEQRDIFFKKYLQYAREDRFVMYDSSDGRSLDFIRTLLRNYREKYPSRYIYLFLDNFHLTQLNSDKSGREKFQTLSHEMKAMVVEFDATIISTVEYTKMPMNERPNNNNIAESNSLVYDSNMIMHGWNELHGLREEAVAYHIDEDGYKRPIVVWGVGKNKIASFKGDIPCRSWPEKAFFVEMTDQEYKAVIAQNRAIMSGESED